MGEEEACTSSADIGNDVCEESVRVTLYTTQDR